MPPASRARTPLQPFLRAGSRDALRETPQDGDDAPPAPQKKPVLVFDGVHKVYRAPSGRDHHVLRGVELSIERGEFVFVTGASGAGKSTLLKLVYRAETVDDGRILFCGRDVARLREDSIPFLRRNLGVVFQDFKIVPTWSVFENVAIALEVVGLSTRVIRQRVLVALERVGLTGRGGDRAGVLSGGEQQRVAIARAIVSEPAMVLADEPTGNLDPALALDVLGLFEEIHAAGTTVLFATHDRTLLDVRARRVLVVEEGRVTDVAAGLDHFAHANSPTPPGIEVRADVRSETRRSVSAPAHPADRFETYEMDGSDDAFEHFEDGSNDGAVEESAPRPLYVTATRNPSRSPARARKAG